MVRARAGEYLSILGGLVFVGLGGGLGMNRAAIRWQLSLPVFGGGRSGRG